MKVITGNSASLDWTKMIRIERQIRSEL